MKKFIIFILTFSLQGCFLRVDPYDPLIRSDIIRSREDESRILAKASLGWTKDGRIRVLHTSGTPYERGYQHGALLRKEIQDNLGYLYKTALSKFYFDEIFQEAYERARPYIPQEYVDEMHGLAHGSKMPLSLIHAIHILPSIGEWGGKKRVRDIVKSMIAGDLGTSCSNISVGSSTTGSDQMYTVRVLDWGLHRISKLHEYPLLHVSKPEGGILNVNIGWVGFLGAISGMNAQGITLGEMGYGDPANETLSGKPMPFLLRDVLSYANNLSEVRKIIGESKGENSYGFLMSDGKTGEAELYIKDAERFLVFKPGEDVRDNGEVLKGIDNMVFGGHEGARTGKLLEEVSGGVTLEVLMANIIPTIAMDSNFQNVIYEPKKLRFWVNNAPNSKVPAHGEPYTLWSFEEVN